MRKAKPMARRPAKTGTATEFAEEVVCCEAPLEELEAAVPEEVPDDASPPEVPVDPESLPEEPLVEPEPVPVVSGLVMVDADPSATTPAGTVLATPLARAWKLASERVALALVLRTVSCLVFSFCLESLTSR